MIQSAARDNETGFTAGAFGRRALGWRGLRRGAVAAIVMAGSFALSCGTNAAGSAVGALKASDILGRWSGTHYGYGMDRPKCAGKDCSLTLDISACPTGWCGVMVKDDGTCGTVAMRLGSIEEKPNFIRFQGKLELLEGSSPYTIQVTLWAKTGDGPRSIGIVGDTGPELRFMRRSFPLEAQLARTGDIHCTPDKATS